MNSPYQNWVIRKFHEKLRKIFLTHFCLIEAKMKMKKYGKMISIFEFSISELGYIELFIKISGKFFFKFFTWEGHTGIEVSTGLIDKTSWLFVK